LVIFINQEIGIIL